MRNALIAFIPIIFLFLATILFGIWVYRDAKAHGENGLLWLFVVILVPNGLGVVLYLLLVKRDQKKLCPKCGTYNPLTNKHCGSCGEDLDPVRVEGDRGSKIWIPALVLLILGILWFIVMVVTTWPQ